MSLFLPSGFDYTEDHLAILFSSHSAQPVYGHLFFRQAVFKMANRTMRNEIMNVDYYSPSSSQ